MSDIMKVPDNELIEDRFQSLCDMEVCREGLRLGIHYYSDGQSTTKRLHTDKRIVKAIEKELTRRGIDFTT